MRVSLFSLLFVLFALTAVVFVQAQADGNGAAPAAAAAASPATPTPTPAAPAAPATPAAAPAASETKSTPAPQQSVDLSPLSSKLDSLAAASSSAKQSLESIASQLKDLPSSLTSSLTSSLSDSSSSSAKKISGDVEKPLQEIKQLVQQTMAAQKDSGAALQHAIQGLATSAKQASSSDSSAAILAALEKITEQIKALEEQQKVIVQKLNEEGTSLTELLSFERMKAYGTDGLTTIKRFGNRTLVTVQEQWPVLVQTAQGHGVVFVEVAREWTKDLPAHTANLAEVVQKEGTQQLRSSHTQLTSLLSDLAKQNKLSVQDLHLAYASYGIIAVVALLVLFITWKIVKALVKAICCCGCCRKTKKMPGSTLGQSPANLPAVADAKKKAAATAAAQNKNVNSKTM